MNEHNDRRANENDRAALDEQVADLPGKISRRWRVQSAAERNAEEFRERVEAMQRAVLQGIESVDDAVVSDVPAGEYAYTTAEGVAALMRSCPVPFRPWLKAVLCDYSAEEGQEFFVSQEFLKNVGRLGLVRAVLAYVDAQDSTAKERRRGEDNLHLPNQEIVADIFLHAIESEDQPYWREVVTKWLPTHWDGDRDEMIRLLTRALGWPPASDSYHAAVHLAELAPEAPGLPERLLDAACDEWVASRDAHYDCGETGADRAVALLARLEASRLRPALLAALAAGRCRSPFAGADLYREWGGDAAELVGRSWDAPADAMPNLLQVLQVLPPDTVGLTARLAALVSECGADGYHALEVFVPHGCQSEKVLPEIAALLGHADSWYRERGRGLLLTFLNALPGNPARWTDEDRWVSALRGKAAAAHEWAVYADWLDDRGDPRGEYVRSWWGLANRPAEADEHLERCENWLNAHGRGWATVYARMESPPADNPDAPAPPSGTQT